MFRAYVIAALVGLGAFGYAQYRGWSMFDDAEQLEHGNTGQVARHK